MNTSYNFDLSVIDEFQKLIKLKQEIISTHNLKIEVKIDICDKEMYSLLYKHLEYTYDFVQDDTEKVFDMSVPCQRLLFHILAGKGRKFLKNMSIFISDPTTISE